MILTRRKLTWRKLTRIESFLFSNQIKLTGIAMKLCKSNEINATHAKFLIFSKFSRRRQLIHRKKTTFPSPESCLNFLLFSIIKGNNTLPYSIVNFEKSEPWSLINWLFIEKMCVFHFIQFLNLNWSFD